MRVCQGGDARLCPLLMVCGVGCLRAWCQRCMALSPSMHHPSPMLIILFVL